MSDVDGPGVEYATAEHRSAAGEAMQSLADWLGLPLQRVLELRDRNELGGEIEHRNLERRALDGRGALRSLERRYVPD